jgi:hypothetical protein
MSNTYPNFQALINHAIVIDNKRKDMEARRGGFKDRPLEATLANVPTHSKASSRGLQGPSNQWNRALYPQRN